jgi:hypothetical protein
LLVSPSRDRLASSRTDGEVRAGEASISMRALGSVSIATIANHGVSPASVMFQFASFILRL